MEIFGNNKLYDHLDKVLMWKNKSSDKTLITAEIDMTNLCNNKCPACAGFKDNKVSLTYVEAKSYISQLKEFGLRGIVFSGGGEPLCNPDTIKTIQFAKSLGIDVGLVTNGLLLDKEACSKLVDCLTWIRISLDAATAKMYKLTHGMEKEYFEIVLKNIKTLVEERERKHTSEDCTIGIGFLTSEDTISEAYDFAKLAKKLRVDYAQFRPFHRDKINILPYLQKIQELETNKFKILASTQKYLHFEEKIERPYNSCDGANFRTVIAADAKVYLCCHMRSNPKYCLGDLRKDSFENVWENRKKIIKNIDFKDCVPFCILDQINRELANINKKRKHENFL